MGVSNLPSTNDENQRRLRVCCRVSKSGEMSKWQRDETVSCPCLPDQVPQSRRLSLDV